MPDAAVMNTLNSPRHGREGAKVPDNRQRWFEVSLVVLVGCGRYILNSLYFLVHGPSAVGQISTFPVGWPDRPGRVRVAASPKCINRRGLGLGGYGLRWSPYDLVAGLLLTAVAYAAYGLGHTVIQIAHHFAYGTWTFGPSAKDFFGRASVGAIPALLLNSVFEEMIVRAYVMTEVMELTGSSILAVAISVGVQFSYHLYYGWLNAIQLCVLFLVFALYYAHSRRALPIIIAHGLVDIYGWIWLQ